VLTIGGTVSEGLFEAIGGNVNMSGQNRTHVAPGAAVSFNFTWAVNRNGYCPGCIEQVVGGLVDANGNVIPGSVSTNSCIDSVGNPSGGNSTFTFTAPTNVGIYYIAIFSTLDFGCDGGGNPGYVLTNPPTTEGLGTYLGSILVF
jgi:hypothetical protein